MILSYLENVVGVAPPGYEFLSYIFSYFLLIASLAIVFSIFYKIIYHIFN